jgi:hypothetical protein
MLVVYWPPINAPVDAWRRYESWAMPADRPPVYQTVVFCVLTGASVGKRLPEPPPNGTRGMLDVAIIVLGIAHTPRPCSWSVPINRPVLVELA